VDYCRLVSMAMEHHSASHPGTLLGKFIIMSLQIAGLQECSYVLQIELQAKCY